MQGRQSYCIKCRTHTANLNEHTMDSKNGLKRIASQCSTCGCNKSSFLPKGGNVQSRMSVARNRQKRVLPSASQKQKVPSPEQFEEYQGEGLKEWVEKAGERWKGVKMAMKGERTNFKPTMRALLEKHGDKPITALRVCRRPLNKNMGKIIEFYRKIRGIDDGKVVHDKYFHLYLVCRLDDGTELLLEKNEDLNADLFKSGNADESLTISFTKNGLTVNNLLQNAKQALGASFFQYDSLSNNCQMFVVGLLKHSRISITQAQEKFILQDTENLLDSFGQKLARLATSTVNRVNTVVQGYGLK